MVIRSQIVKPARRMLVSCSWKLCNQNSLMLVSVLSYAPTVHLSDTQVEVFFSRGKQKVFTKHLHHFGSDYSKMHKWDLFMFWRSVDIRGHCRHVPTVNWSIRAFSSPFVPFLTNSKSHDTPVRNDLKHFGCFQSRFSREIYDHDF